MRPYPHVIASLFTLFAFALAAQAADAAEVPRTAAAGAASALIARAERAITQYVAACSSRDAERLSSVTTDDVRIEFTLDDPGTYLTLTSDALLSSCTGGLAPSGKAQMWIFPTNEMNAVFVQYEVSAPSAGAATRQLALVEMRGEQIAAMRNFGPAPAAAVASNSLLAVATSCSARTNE